MPLILVALGLASLPREAPGADAPIRRAWELAQASGSYGYEIDLRQTVTAAPSLAGAGANPASSQQVRIAGKVDQPRRLLELTIAANGSQAPGDALGVKVENGQTFGRQGDGAWQPMEQSTDLFAPGGDPLGFLSGVDEVRDLGPETRALGPETLRFQRYGFVFDGDGFADFMGERLERQLRERGALPPSLSVNAGEAYRQMAGAGEIWLDDQGLPRRITLELSLPPQADGGTATASIRSDFFDFDKGRLAAAGSFWDSPGGWLGFRLERIAAAARPLAPSALLVMLEIALLALAVRFWRRRRTQALMAISMIAALLLSPLFQAQGVAAFYAGQEAAQSEQSAGQDSADQRQQALDQIQQSWDPHAAPGDQPLGKPERGGNPPGVAAPAGPVQTPPAGSPQGTAPAAQTASPGLDTDGDGLSDADEAIWGTCPSLTAGGSACAGVARPRDTDGDNLSDGAEVNELGTLPRLADSDGDSIDDDLEATGFSYKGMQWYLDPLNTDSNYDGTIDSAECPAWSSASAAPNRAAICPDSDGDGQPNLFDADNDNDGVEDRVDLSPDLASTAVFTRGNPLRLQAANLQLNKPVFVDIQLRPTDARHLEYSSRILDWPAGDRDGQIVRALDTSFATTGNPSIRSSDPNAANGDVKVVPLLEITMPNAAGHYAGLPVTTTYQSVSRPAGLPVGRWLDTAELAPYGITVRDADASSGDLVAYAPIIPVVNSVGGTTAAFAARMVYHPEQGAGGVASWPVQHQARVVWAVEMITDRCVDPAADPATCAREEQLSLVHVYDEAWSVTGLAVTEEHGAKAALVYERPQADGDLKVDDKLWMVAWNLNKTFIRGRDCDALNGAVCQSDGRRDVRIDNLAAQIGAWSANASGIGVQTFEFPHGGHLIHLGMTHVRNLLDSQFGAFAGQTNPTILVAHEKTSRSRNLQDMGGFSGGAALINLDPATVKAATIAGMSWSPYEYVGGAWQNYGLDAYLTLLADTLEADPHFLSGELPEDIPGKLIWAQALYASINQGFLALAEVEGIPVWKPSLRMLTEADYQPGWFAPPDAGSGFVIISRQYLTQLAKVQADIAKADSLERKWSSFEKAVKGSAISAESLAGLKRIQAVTNYALRGTVGLIVVGGILLLIGVAYDNQAMATSGSIILAAAGVLQSIIQMTMIVSQAVAAIRAGATLGQTLSTLNAIGKANMSSAIGVLIAVVFIWGIFGVQILLGQLVIGTTAFYHALAATIATTIVVLIFFVIGLIPIVGLLIVGLVAVIDFILACFKIQGFQSWLIESIADALYDTDHIIDNLADPERLEFAFTHLDLANPALGFVSSNALSMTMVVTNTLHYYADSDNGEARRATFRYWLQRTDADQHADLDANDMRDEWTALPGRRVREVAQIGAPGAIPLRDFGTGVNRTLDGSLYLTEAYVEPYEGCWTLFGEEVDCEWYENKGSSHLNLGRYQVVDVLPNTIDEFMRQSWNSNADLPLGRQTDFDGDGLRSQQAGGVDPDDTLADADSDGLSDRYELSAGLNPRQADSDGDRLGDRQELALFSNPRQADGDGDGLVDYVEAKQGWLIRYANLTDGQPRLSRIWSDPNTIDADNDSLSDLEEYTFGFNPLVATDPSLIDDLIQIEAPEVSEADRPLLLLAQFNEPLTAQRFADSSGADRSLACADGGCPRSGAGRYGNGGAFDGSNDVLDTGEPVAELARGSFTLAAWVKTRGNRQAIFTKNDGDATWERGEKSFYLNGAGQPTFVGFGNGYVTSSRAVNDGAWHHVAVTWDYGGGTAGTASIFIDGADATNRASTTYAANNPDNAGDSLKLGRPNHNFSEAFFHFNGTLDEAAVAARALPPAELAALMGGRHNPDDGLLVPGAALTYSAAISNTLPAQAAHGHLSAASQIVNPAVGNANVALRLENADRKHTYRNDAGASSTATCVGAACPAAELLRSRDYAARFDGLDDSVFLPLQIRTAPPNAGRRVISFTLKLEALPAPGQTAAIYTSSVSETGALSVYLNSDGKLVFSVGGAVSDSYSGGGTYDPEWSGPHISAYSFAGRLNTWVKVLWEYPAIATRTSSRIFINDAQDSTVGYELWPGVAIGDGWVGANGATPSFKGSLNDLRAIDGIGTDVLKLRFDEDYGYDGDFYHNTVGGQAPIPCTDALPATCPAYRLDGRNNQAIRFDGVDDYLTLPTPAALTGYDEWEILALALRLEELPPAGQLAYLLDTTCTSAEDCVDVAVDSQGRLVIRTNAWTPRITDPVFSAANLNTWVSLRFQWNIGSDIQDSLLWVYVNNVLISQNTIGNISDLKHAPGRVGRALDGGGGLRGSIDNLVISRSYDVNFDAPPFDVDMLNRVNGARVAGCDYGLTCPAETAGHNGRALAFDGADDYLRLDRTISDDWTIAFWMKTPQATGAAASWWQGKGLIDATSPLTSAAGFGLALGDGGKILFGAGAAGAETTIKGGAVADNQWHHVAATRAKATGALKLYVDGALVAGGTGPAGSLVVPELRLGALLTGANHFQGALDEIAVIPSATELAGVRLLMRTTYPAIGIAAAFEPFSLGPLSSLVADGAALVNPDAISSRHRFDQEAEAAIALQQEIAYPVNDENAANLSVLIHFEEPPGSAEFKNAGDVSYWTDRGYDKTRLLCAPPHCPTAGLRGQSERAAYFDGNGDHLTFASPDCDCTPFVLTVAAWVKGDSGTIADFRRANQYDGMQLDFNRFVVTIDKDGASGQGGYVNHELTFDLPEQQWTHVAGVVDRTARMAYVYVNGQLAGSKALPELAGSQARMGTRFPSVGRNSGDGNDYFRGYLDDLRVYSVPLSAAQIQALYQTSVPQLKLEFDEDQQATEFRDSSQNGYLGKPSATQCATVTLDSLGATQLAVNPSPIFVAKGGDRLASATIPLGATRPLTASAVLCAGDTLSVGRINNDGSLSTFATQPVNLAPGAGGATFQNPANRLRLDWTVADQPLYRYNPAPGADGKIGRTVLFDGAGFIRIDKAEAVGRLQNRLTVMGWVNPDALAGASTIQRFVAAGRQLSFNGWGFGLNGAALQFDLIGGAKYTSSATVTPRVWQHVAVVFDGNNDARFYLDGQHVDTIPGANPAGINLDDPLFVGATSHSNGTLAEPYRGQLDELSIYSRELNDAEIFGHYMRDLRWYRARSTTYLTVDADQPAVELLSTYAYRANQPFQLAVAATDPTSRVTLVDVSAQAAGAGAPSWQGAPPCAEAGASGAAWCPTITPAGEGELRLSFRAVDAVGWQTIGATTTLRIDGSAPAATVANAQPWRQLAPEPGAELAWTVALSGTVSDPALGAGLPGSGVDPQSVFVSLLDERGEPAGPAQRARVNGAAWSIDYRFAGARPGGSYAVRVAASDLVGNRSDGGPGAAPRILLDARPPAIDLLQTIAPGNLISETWRLTGTLSEAPAWAGAVARYHFEDSAPLADSSGQASHAACDSCPVAAAGQFGAARSFAAARQTDLTVPAAAALNLSQGTFSAWIKPAWPSGAGADPAILALAGGGAARYRWEISADYGGMAFFNGATRTQVPAAIVPNQWQHVALVHDGGSWTGYLNGVAVGAAALPFGAAADLPLHIGSADGQSGFFTGELDELAIYGRALSAAEIYALAQAEIAGTDRTELWLEDVRFDGTVAAENWQPAAASGNPGLAVWRFAPPAGVENFYQLRARGRDRFGNQSGEALLWRGEIDTRAPRVAIAALTAGGGSAAYTDYLITAEDLFIDEESLATPCANPTISYGRHSNPARVNKLTATCRVSGHPQGQVQARACDYAGHCVTAAAAPTPGAPGAVLIASPAAGSVISGTRPLSITGGAFADDGLSELRLYADDELIETVSYPAGVSDDPWALTWQPARVGGHALRVELRDRQQRVYTDAITLTLVNERAPGGVLAGLGLWLDAGAGLTQTLQGGSAAAWVDQASGWAAINATDRAPTLAPESLNFNPTLRFGANGPSELNFGANLVTAPPGSSGMTIFAVVAPDASAGTRNFILDAGFYQPQGYGLAYGPGRAFGYVPQSDQGGSPGQLVEATPPAGADPALLTYGVSFGTGSQLARNGAVLASAANTATTRIDRQNVMAGPVHADGTGPLTIGRQAKNSSSAARYFQGRIAEIIIYSADLSAAERQRVESRLALKYGLTLSRGTAGLSYTNALGRVVWDAGANAAYHRNVAGIGRDDAGALLQPRSRSVTGNVLTVAAEQPLADQQFLVWGDDGQSLTSVVSGTTGALNFARLARVWRFAETGAPGAARLSVDLSALPAGAQPVLLIGGRADFQGARAVRGAIAGGQASFSADLADGEYLAIALRVTAGLTVARGGDGAGAVTSQPAGIDCGAACRAEFAQGTAVTLTASPAAGSTFVGWSGACSGAGSCAVLMDQTRAVTATFAVAIRSVGVSFAGDGSGAVTISPLGVTCTPATPGCVVQVPAGTTLTLAATPAAGSTFAGWSGACSGTAACVVTADESRAVTARFNRITVYRTYLPLVRR